MSPTGSDAQSLVSGTLSGVHSIIITLKIKQKFHIINDYFDVKKGFG